MTISNAAAITLDGVTKTVYVAGSGPAVIVMAEMPGISPHVARFARWVREAGFTVYMPSLFGRDGAVPEADEGAQIFQRACVSAEFRALTANVSSPVTLWLRALARLAHQECGGAGVGAIGMCFTGNFALSMMLEPAMLAPVLSQPSLPLNDPAGIEIAPDELKAGPRAARARGPHRSRLPLQGRQVLHCSAVCRLHGSARRPLRRPRAAGQRGEHGRPAFLRAARDLAAQRGDRASHRRSRSADHRRARRDPRVLRAQASCLDAPISQYDHILGLINIHAAAA